MFAKFKAAYKTLENKALLPQWCYHCGSYMRLATNTGICSNCTSQLPWWNEEICANCINNHDSHFYKYFCYSCSTDFPIYPIFIYTKPIKSWICSMKYNKNFYSTRILSKIIQNYFNHHSSFFSNYDFIIPVPTTQRRFFTRGFNQANDLLQYLPSSKIKLDLAKRLDNSKAQVSLKGKERKKNKIKFSISPEVKNKNILIFDDVVVSQTTVKNLADKIIKKGAKNLAIFCLAKTVSGKMK